ncbi:Mannan-binding lectin serine protease 1 [Toxocara canis]|uniref:Mannan-binding lectin serine protease 1 n=1 Tax=Toxocara canis TaxID=6265 RepID=A0A0B2UZ01_TOXCA|nr:Mannan-binding lectin serine protease 1 [Toxocara canis]
MGSLLALRISRRRKTKEWLSSWTVYHSGECIPFSDDKCERGHIEAIPCKIRSVIVPKVFFDENCTRGDLAIIELQEKIFPAFLARPLCLASKESDVPPKAELASWGSDASRIRSVTTLTRINIKTIVCPKEQMLFSEAICASESQDENICKGDSGAGMVYRDKEGRRHVIGIASYGTDCRIIQMALDYRDELDEWDKLKELKGSVFTDIRPFTDFICKYTGVCRDGQRTIDDDQRAIKDTRDAVIQY